MPKNIPTTVELYLFHMLTRLCWKSFKLGFSSMWTEDTQTHKLGLEKAVEPEIKLSKFVGSWRKQGSPRKPICFIDYCEAFDCTDHKKEKKKLWKIIKETERQE